MSAALVVRSMQARRAAQLHEQVKSEPVQEGGVEVAFYRKYTEGMLRRYMYRSMEIGRVPALLGEFTFRGKSSRKKGYTFEDSVIFVYDVERCLKGLKPMEREMVKRIALQEYTVAETAAMTRTSVRTVGRRYFDALDQLTRVFLRLELMQVPGSCQVPN
jgi:hypothetical protein